MVNKISGLIYVPILHTYKEVGDIMAFLREDGSQRPAGCSGLEQENAIKEMWDGIFEKIRETNLHYPAVRIYQEALLIGGIEREVVEKLAEKGSRNHQLILELMKKGAKLEETENPDLLIKEVDYLRHLITQHFSSPQNHRLALEEYKNKSTKLMEQRDAFIAERIKSTIKQGETPLVFMGVRHQLEKLLKYHFVITYIIYRLPFRKTGDVYNV